MVICTSAKLASHQKVLRFTPILEAAHFSSETEMMIASYASQLVLSVPRPAGSHEQFLLFNFISPRTKRIGLPRSI